MAINITLDGTGDSPLKKQLDERAAANRAALNSRNEDRRNEEKISEIAAAVQTQEQQDKKKNNATLAKLKPEEQTASIRGGGFQFYYTFSEAATEVVDGTPPTSEITRMRSTYQTLVSRYGGNWPTGVVEVNQLSPSYHRAAVKYDTPFSVSYEPEDSDPIYTLSKLSNLNSLLHPEAVEAPFTQLQIKPVDPPTNAYAARPLLRPDTPTLIGGFPGSLSSGYNRRNNIMFAVGPDYLWDVQGWPAPFQPRPPDGPLVTPSKIPSFRYEGGNTRKFPSSYVPLQRRTLKVTKITEDFVRWRRCFPGDGLSPCDFYTSAPFAQSGPLGISFFGSGGYYHRFLVPVTSNVYSYPYDTGARQPAVNLVVPPATEVSFRPALLLAAQQASAQGFVVPYIITFGGFFFPAAALNINILDFTRNLAPDEISGTSRRNDFKAFIDTQYPIAKKIERMVENPNQTFFSIINHRIGARSVDGYEPLLNNTTPYTSLNQALNLIRFLTRDSFLPDSANPIFSLIDSNIVGAPFTAETRARAKELVRIRQKTARAMVAQYLGRETVEVIRIGDFDSAAARGKLQG